MLASTLEAVRKRISKRPKLNENDTKATLIEPVRAALGWDVHDVEQVAPMPCDQRPNRTLIPLHSSGYPKGR